MTARDRIGLWLARHMPTRLRYWCVIQAISQSTTGRWSTQVVPDLLAMDVLKRISPEEGDL